MIPLPLSRCTRSCLRLFRVFICVLGAVLFGVAPGHTQDASGEPYSDPDAASCPLRVIFYLESGATEEKYVGYATRGADAFFSPVFYSFSNVKSASGGHTVSGTFYVYGLECRLASWLSYNGVMSPPPWRYEFFESKTVACSGTGAQPVYREAGYDPNYDPYSDAEGENCGGSGGDQGGRGDNCQSEWLVVERSDDGGATWYVVWEGWGTVCP